MNKFFDWIENLFWCENSVESFAHKIKRLFPSGKTPFDKLVEDSKPVKNKISTRFLYKGMCAVCDRPVFHAFPWYTKNPDKGGKPLHDECQRKYYGD